MMRWLTVCLLVLSAGIAVGQLEFDGVGDYLSLGTISEITAIENATICAWIRVDTYGNQKGIFGNEASGWSRDVRLSTITNGLNARVQTTTTGQQLDVIYATTNKNWQHVAMVIDGTNVLLYVDGASVASGANSFIDAGFVANKSFFGAVAYDGLPLAGTYFDGSIFDQRIYNRALTADEVQALYEYGLNPRANQIAVDYIAIATGTNALVFSGSGPVGYRGGDAVTNLTVYYDQSQEANHGTIYGTPTISETPWQGTAP